MNRRIGIFLPFIFLIIFAFLFHPSTQILLESFSINLTDFFLSPQIFFLLASLWILTHRKVKRQHVGIVLPPSRYVGTAVLLGIFPYLVLTIVNYNVGRLSGITMNYEKIPVEYSLLFSFLVLAPITEELFFRGVVFTALKENYSVATSVIASSLLFMASHSPLALGPLVLGIIASILTQKSKSILPAIIFHSLSNGLPLFFANYCQNLYPFQKWLFLKF